MKFKVNRLNESAVEPETIDVSSKEEIDELGSALTIEGLDLASVNDFLDWVDNYCGLNERRAYVIKGKVMNDEYELTGDNRYPDDLNIVAIDLEDIADFRPIITRRFEIGARWLDDIVDNNLFREGRGE